MFFTSDTHFGHKAAALRFRKGFTCVEEMNKLIIERWNVAVSPNDEVYHLGDFGMASVSKVLHPCFNELNGRIHLVLGNHDNGLPRHFLDKFASVQYYKEIKIHGVKTILSHYAMRIWNQSHYGAFMLYGHSHANLSGFGRSMDVGVDTNNLIPYHEDEVYDRLITKEIKFIDHHTETTNL